MTYDPLGDVRRHLIAPRRLVGGQPIQLTACKSFHGYVVALGPEDGQVTIRLQDCGDRDLVVDAAKVEPLKAK